MTGALPETLEENSKALHSIPRLISRGELLSETKRKHNLAEAGSYYGVSTLWIGVDLH